MPLIYGSYLAGSLLSTLLPVILLICFATFFYRQARRQKATKDAKAATSTAPETPAQPGQQLSNQ